MHSLYEPKTHNAYEYTAFVCPFLYPICYNIFELKKFYQMQIKFFDGNICLSK